MKVLVIKIIIIFLIPQLVFTQTLTNKNFGYTSSSLLWTTHTPVRNGTNILPRGEKVYYVGTNNKICEYYWSNGNWTGGGQLEWGSYYVKIGTQIVNYDGDIFFIGSSDSRIYRLRWTSSTGWVASVLNSSSVPVRQGSDLIVYSNHIYYVGTNNRICNFVTEDNGDTWTGGEQLLWGNNITNVRTNTQIHPQNNKIYYIGSNGLICEYMWTGPLTGWVGGEQLDWSGNINTFVKNGNDICVSESNGIYYKSANNNRIYNLTWSSTSGWTTVSTQCTVVPKDAIDLISIDNRVFFVGSVDNKIYELLNFEGGNYTYNAIDVNMLPVKNNTELHLTYNNIFISGSTNTFKSYQLTYISNDYKINYCIYDYTYDPISETFSTDKTWHIGKLNNNSSTIYNSNTFITNSGKQFYYVGENSYVHTFLRSVLNSSSKTNYNLTWDQNFDVPDPYLASLKTSWNSQLPHGSGPRLQDCNMPYTCPKSYSKYFDNCSINNGVLSLMNKFESTPYSAIEWGEFQLPNTSWYWLNHQAPFVYSNYNYTSALITSGMQNYRGIMNNNPFAYPYPNGGAQAPENITFDQKYGWFETRCRVPRGKNIWSAFWMLQTTGGIPPEIDVFEIGGDGGSMKCSDFIDYGLNQIHLDEIAIGYRFYDDFYTYALSWSPNELKYYLNNELIATISNGTNLWVPSNNMYLILSSAVDLAKSNSELEIYPNYMEIDYVRTYSEIPNMRLSEIRKITSSKRINVFPNPSNNYFNFEINEADEKSTFIMEIYSLIGQKIITKVINNKVIISKDELGLSGVYFYKVLEGNKVLDQGHLMLK